MRVFFAISVPQPITETLAVAQKKLRGNWRPVRQDQMHITLAFAPQISEKLLERLIQHGNAVGSAHAPFTVRLRGTGFFPNEGSPRVWFVKVDSGENKPLEALAADIRELEVGYESQAFKPHITLARKKGPAPRLEPMQWELSWEVKGFTLLQSILHKSGPEYRVLKRFRLLAEAAGSSEQTADSSANISADTTTVIDTQKPAEISLTLQDTPSTGDLS